MKILTDLSVIRGLSEKYNFEFSKNFGQNFLINPSVCPKIADIAVEGEVGVIEVGPGFGVLTRELSKAAKKVVCIEIDKSLLPVLDETLKGYDNVKVVNDDVLKVDLKKLISDEFGGMDVVVAANLPYNITSPVIMKLLESNLPIKSITVMVQKEAAIRLCAPPGTRQCGRVSAGIRFFATPRRMFSVSRGNFYPAPNVDSEVITLKLHKPLLEGEKRRMYFKIVKAAFSQRRKTVINPVSGFLGISKDELREVFSDLGLKPTVRAENLTEKDFVAVADALVERENLKKYID